MVRSSSARWRHIGLLLNATKVKIPWWLWPSTSIRKCSRLTQANASSFKAWWSSCWKARPTARLWGPWNPTCGCTLRCSKGRSRTALPSSSSQNVGAVGTGTATLGCASVCSKWKRRKHFRSEPAMNSMLSPGLKNDCCSLATCCEPLTTTGFWLRFRIMKFPVSTSFSSKWDLEMNVRFTLSGPRMPSNRPGWCCRPNITDLVKATPRRSAGRCEISRLADIVQSK